MIDENEKLKKLEEEELRKGLLILILDPDFGSNKKKKSHQSYDDGVYEIEYWMEEDQEFEVLMMTLISKILLQKRRFLISVRHSSLESTTKKEIIIWSFKSNSKNTQIYC